MSVRNWDIKFDTTFIRQISDITIKAAQMGIPFWEWMNKYDSSNVEVVKARLDRITTHREQLISKTRALVANYAVNYIDKNIPETIEGIEARLLKWYECIQYEQKYVNHVESYNSQDQILTIDDMEEICKACGFNYNDEDNVIIEQLNYQIREFYTNKFDMVYAITINQFTSFREFSVDMAKTMLDMDTPAYSNLHVYNYKSGLDHLFIYSRKPIPESDLQKMINLHLF